MKKIKYILPLLFCAFLITGCGETTEEKDVDNTLSCTYTSDMLNEDSSIKLVFEEDKIVEADMTFAYDGGFDQSYGDTVCTSYEGNEGITCEATVTGEDSEVRSSYHITGTDDAGTKAFLEFKDSITGNNLEEFKTSLEDQGYVCE